MENISKKPKKCSEIFDGEGTIVETPCIFPPGLIKFEYGEDIEVNEYFTTELLKAFYSNAYGQKIPITVEHEDGEAKGWIQDLILENGSVKMKVDWLEGGIELLESRKFAYYSPEVFIGYKDATGIVWPYVLRAVSFTNFPRIKNTNAAIKGFSENEEKEEELFEELLSQFEGLCKKINSHKELFRQKGAPRLRSALSLINENLKSYKKNNKEAVNEMGDKKETKETPAVQINFKEELQKAKEEMKVEMKAEFDTQLVEMKQSINAEAEKRVSAAEARATATEARLEAIEKERQEEEDLAIFERAVRGEVALMKDKDRILKKLKAARKSGLVKLSEKEGDTYDYYEEAKKEILGSSKKISYKELGTSAGFNSDTQEVTLTEVKELAEKKMQDGKDRVSAFTEAKVELGYQTIQCKE